MALSDRIPPRLKRALRPVQPLVRAVRLWSDAGGMRMSAAVSFYGVLSLAPLLLVMVGALGWWMDRTALEENLLRQLGGMVGEQGAGVLRDTLRSAQQPKEGLLASVLGFGVLLFAATGVFTELQDAFERVWSHGRGAPPADGFWHTATLRLRGIGYVLVFGFLLLVSLVISTLLTLFSGWAGTWFPLEYVLRLVNEMVAFAICAGLFVGLMRLSGGPKPAIRFLAAGAVIGAILFTVGRQVMALYLASAAVVSAYGAAGSLVVLLLWIYFSSAVLLLGAGCARGLEEHAAELHARGATVPGARA